MGEQAEFSSIAVGPSYWAGDIVDHATSIHPSSRRSERVFCSLPPTSPSSSFIETLKELLVVLPFPSFPLRICPHCSAVAVVLVPRPPCWQMGHIPVLVLYLPSILQLWTEWTIPYCDLFLGLKTIYHSILLCVLLL